MKKTKEFWDRNAPRYARSPIRDEKAYRKKLTITQEYFRPDWSVLEFGCGTGSTAIVHAPYVKRIDATDISDRMLEIAERKAAEAGVENISFRQGTLESLALEPESYDAVLGLNVLHLLEDVEAAISRVHGLLKPGGIFVSSTVLIDDINAAWRMLIPLMQFVGFAPYVNRFGRQQLVSRLTDAGFGIDREWQPRNGSVFIVARKRS
ncbi:class I SAM-dependent methyltransferase [Luteimonas sp. SJ-92]|uniref:Class I SAM-dependent methyltransferase n=1 Tax=Luteimonas salinisoli TaxID=2752307 RepID=A0A853JJL8_9GAMM|nr:class I SAM-dependent methyltransferase [Luteimonas salinisoli]